MPHSNLKHTMPRTLTLTFLLATFMLTACGYKGDLYLPKENDKAKFGVIQTGLQFEPKEPTTQPEQ